MFIVFDGIDKAGKTTNLKLAAEWLSALGVKNKITREPGGTKLGEIIREVFLNSFFDSKTRSFLMAAMRNEHTKQIKEWLEQEWVLSDRFVDSTYAYQGVELSENFLDFLAQNSVNIKPDHTFLFLEAIAKADDLMDEEAEKHKDKIIEIFKTRASRFPNRYTIVSRETIPNQQEIIKTKIKEFL